MAYAELTVLLTVALMICASVSATPDCSSCVQAGFHCYLFLNETDTYSHTQAFEMCKTAGGKLPFFKIELSYKRYLKASGRVRDPQSDYFVWLDYYNYQNHSAANPGNWTSATGESGFTWFRHTNPENANGNESCVQDGGWDWAARGGAGYERGRWIDEPCDNRGYLTAVNCQCPARNKC